MATDKARFIEQSTQWHGKPRQAKANAEHGQAKDG